MNQMRAPNLLTALALSGVALAAGPAIAHADGGGTTPFIQYETAFSGQVENLQAGQTVDVNYVDPSQETVARQFCWSPAPVGQPACGAARSGMLAQAGTQTVTAILNTGKTLSTSFQVADAGQSFKRTIQLRPNTTFTYHLRVPAGYQESSVSYSLYPTTGPGYAISSPIGAGRQPAYFGATVLGTKFTRNELEVAVKTSKLSRPMTLQLAARGTVG
jgi:hypothetical protein